MSLSKDIIEELGIVNEKWEKLITFEKNIACIQISYSWIKWPKLTKKILVIQVPPLQNPFGNLNIVEQKCVGKLIKNIYENLN